MSEFEYRDGVAIPVSRAALLASGWSGTEIDAARLRAVLTQLDYEEERFSRYDPDPFMFRRLREVAAGRCAARCDGGALECLKCGEAMDENRPLPPLALYALGWSDAEIDAQQRLCEAVSDDAGEDMRLMLSAMWRVLKRYR